MKNNYTKKDIALSQLRRAIQLYAQEDYVCALTLAGAAEEIFGKIVEKYSGTNALEEDIKAVDKVAAFFGTESIGRKRLIQKRNKARNELKHNEPVYNGLIESDFKLEAEALIDRALQNYSFAYGENPQDRVIKRYVNLHY